MRGGRQRRVVGGRRAVGHRCKGREGARRVGTSGRGRARVGGQWAGARTSCGRETGALPLVASSSSTIWRQASGCSPHAASFALGRGRAATTLMHSKRADSLVSAPTAS